MFQYTSGKQKIETPQKMMKEKKKKRRRCRQDLTENRIQQEVNNIKFGIKKTLNEMITELNSFFSSSSFGLFGLLAETSRNASQNRMIFSFWGFSVTFESISFFKGSVTDF